jgi:hypothetical protein
MSNGTGAALALCPQCAHPTHEVPNPFYGTGMSVHQWLVICDVCTIATYKSSPELELMPSGDVAQKRRWPWLGRRNERNASSR